MESEEKSAEWSASEICNDGKLLVPSLKNIACKYLQPPFPPEDERYFKMNSMPLWSFRKNSSSEEELESEVNAPDQIGDWNPTTNKSRFITLKSPKLQILMEKKEFLDHCDLVRSGSKRQQKPEIFYVSENQSEPNVQGTSNILVANCSVDLDVNMKGEIEKNLEKEEISEKTQNKLTRANESNTSRDFKNELSRTRNNDNYVVSRVAQNSFRSTDDNNYSRKSVIDLVKHFEQIHLKSKPKHQSTKNASRKDLSATKNS